jgi:phospholipid-translocating ATPase
MGILVQNIDTQKLIFYVKGADSVFGQNVKLEDLTFIEENCHSLANAGLRTMVVAQKRIRERDYQTWKTSQIRKVSKGGSKIAAEEKLSAHFEKDVSLLCVTGIEDKLQEGVKSTLQRLREAGIQLWMLTGDKFETAKSIAISSGMKPSDYDSIEILKPQADLISRAIDEFDIEKKVVFISGDCFDVIFQNLVLEIKFFEKVLRCVNVNVCRCSPKQKTKIVSHLKQKQGKIVCAVGDGGNDVGMIKKASVGLGIRGKEGLQASLASDFSISQFKAINDLVFWHGRNAILNSSNLTLYSFYRSFIYSLSMIYFCIFFHGDIDIIYRGTVILLYFNMLTNFFAISLVQQNDLAKPQIMNYARLYRMSQKGQAMSAHNMIIVLWVAIAQILGVYGLIFIVFPGVTYEFFSFLLLTCHLGVVYLSVFSFSHKGVRSYLVALALSIVILVAVVGFDSGFYFQTTSLTWLALGKIAMIAVIVWAPLEIAIWCRKFLYPSTVEKIMTEMKIMEERKKNNENLKIIL